MWTSHRFWHRRVNFSLKATRTWSEQIIYVDIMVDPMCVLPTHKLRTYRLLLLLLLHLMLDLLLLLIEVIHVGIVIGGLGRHITAVADKVRGTSSCLLVLHLLLRHLLLGCILSSDLLAWSHTCLRSTSLLLEVIGQTGQSLVNYLHFTSWLRLFELLVRRHVNHFLIGYLGLGLPSSKHWLSSTYISGHYRLIELELSLLCDITNIARIHIFSQDCTYMIGFFLNDRL